jgi:hypothetical protein
MTVDKTRFVNLNFVKNGVRKILQVLK